MPEYKAIAIPDSWLAPAACHRSIGTGRNGLLSCGLISKPSTGWDVRKARSDHYSVVWCLRGHGRYHDHRGRVHDVGPGDVFHRFTDRTHGNELDPDGRWVEAYIGFGKPMGQALIAMQVLDPDWPVVHVGLDLVILRALIQERDALRAAPDRDLPVHLGCLLNLHQQLLARVQRSTQPRAHDVQLDDICRRLADEPRVSLHALASACGLSYERFRKIFRDRQGVSPHEYRIRRRMDQARSALQASNRPIAEIASDLGYANPFQFSAQFKHLTGMSPSAYRQCR